MTLLIPFAAGNLAFSDLDHAAWSRAAVAQLTHYWSGDVAPPERQAEARLLWTPDALAVRFVCQQSEPLQVNETPDLSRKTMQLWNQDVCEIFVAPDSPERYFEFEASPLGEWVDLAISFKPGGRETDFEFHSGMSAAAIVDVDQITVAIQIPWSEFLPKPAKGDAWRVNLFRCVGVGDERYLAWQPTYAAEPNFHVPEVFGWLEFL